MVVKMTNKCPLKEGHCVLYKEIFVLIIQNILKFHKTPINKRIKSTRNTIFPKSQTIQLFAYHNFPPKLPVKLSRNNKSKKKKTKGQSREPFKIKKKEVPFSKSLFKFIVNIILEEFTVSTHKICIFRRKMSPSINFFIICKIFFIHQDN